MGDSSGNTLLRELHRERQARQLKDVATSNGGKPANNDDDDDVLIVDAEDTPPAVTRHNLNESPSKSTDVADDHALALRLQREEEAAVVDTMDTASQWAIDLASQDGSPSLDWGGFAAAGSRSPAEGLPGHVDNSATLTDDQVCPDAHQMFLYYDKVYFGSLLTEKAVVVEWSKRMTLCAGQCSYRGKGSMCRIALSEPLLRFRSATEVKDTLLHEMIHAWQFVSSGNRDRDDHGPIFCGKMREINAGLVPDMYRPACGYGVSVYHTFTDEVQFHRQHWWRCDRCQSVVKRAMNRAPSAKDCREYRTDPAKMRACTDPRCNWHSHQSRCGGAYTKIHEPQKPGAAASGNGKGPTKGGTEGVTKEGGGPGPDQGETTGGPARKKLKGGGGKKTILDFFNSASAGNAGQGNGREGLLPAADGKSRAGGGDGGAGPSSGVLCPVCCAQFDSQEAVAAHIDSCLQLERRV